MPGPAQPLDSPVVEPNPWHKYAYHPDRRGELYQATFPGFQISVPVRQWPIPSKPTLGDHKKVLVSAPDIVNSRPNEQRISGLNGPENPPAKDLLFTSQPRQLLRLGNENNVRQSKTRTKAPGSQNAQHLPWSKYAYRTDGSEELYHVTFPGFKPGFKPVDLIRQMHSQEAPQHNLDFIKKKIPGTELSSCRVWRWLEDLETIPPLTTSVMDQVGLSRKEIALSAMKDRNCRPFGHVTCDE